MNKTHVFNSLSTSFAVAAMLCIFLQPARCEAKMPLLKGTIVLDEYLSPMPDALMPGNGFDNSFSVVSVSAGDKWYQVPPWMAGRWTHRGKETATRTDVTTGKSETRELEIAAGSSGSWGCVKDKNGVIWDRAPIGEWLEWQYKDHPVEHGCAISGQTKLLDNGQFVIKSIDLLVSADKSSGKILSAAKSESIHTYTSNPDSSISVHSVGRTFDRSGHPKFDRVNDFVMEKIAEIDFASPKYLQARREFFSFWLTQSGYLDKLKSDNQLLSK